MDPKASAKSKRSYTHHGRKAHLPPAAVAHKAKAARDGAASAHHRALPSNWDRYAADVYEDVVGLYGADTYPGAKQPDDGEIRPKSKGADLGYLIEQAKSQPKDFGSTGSRGSSSLDDFSFDSLQGMSSILSVRGKSLLALCGDDNFVVDVDSTSSSEVPFLSIDLQVLSAQLSKLKLSQRLFIEADLLPEELECVEGSESTSASKIEKTSKPDEFNPCIGSGDLPSLSVSGYNPDNPTPKTGELKLGTGSGEKEPHTSPLAFTEVVESRSSRGREMLKPISQTKTCTSSESEQEKSTAFEAAASEAELDMLLNSFTETNLSSSMQGSEINPTTGRPLHQVSSYSTNVASTSLDDSIDDLLAETATSLNDQKHTAVQKKTNFHPPK